MLSLFPPGGALLENYSRTTYASMGALVAARFYFDRNDPKSAKAQLQWVLEHGRTDDFGYNVVERPVHVHDLQATILHLLGLDHERLTYRHAGRDFRLTDVAGNLVREVLA